MCLVALAIDTSRRFPLVIATNRDEFHARRTAPLGWWLPQPETPAVLSGRDLEAGGTWLGLNAAGRLALLTNIRRPHAVDPHAPSRGHIVPLWLSGRLAPDRFWMQVTLSGHNPFNLIAADFSDPARGLCFWGSSDSPAPRRLATGLYGLSNASLDTPWPKVTRLKAGLAAALAGDGDLATLQERLFRALARRELPPDDALPSTGVSLDRERALAPAFIEMPDAAYGTRCSTLLITERIGADRCITHVVERSFVAGSTQAVERNTVLADWPPASGQNASPGPIDERSVAR